MSFVYIMPFIILAVCFLLNAPVGLSMIAACVTFFVTSGQDVSLVSDIIMNSLYTNTVMIAIPLFIFTANIMNSGKVTEYMFTFAKGCVGRKRGAMAYVNVLVSLIFSGMTGSALADASGIGLMEIDEMQRDGYDTPFSCAITAATATIGPIFPPSIPMVVYAMLSGTSVGSLFMGGVVPALMITVALCLYVGYISKKRDYPRGHQFTLREFLSYTLRALPALFTPVILIGGIYTGITTPTEAAVVSVVYSLIVSIFVYKTMTLKSLIPVTNATIRGVAPTMLVVAGATTFGRVLTMMQVPQSIAMTLTTVFTSKVALLLAINVFLLFVGMIMETMAAILICTPIFLPVVTAIGMDPIQFGVIMIVNLAIGFITPPVGINLYVSSNMTGVPVLTVARRALPYIACLLIALLMFTFIPELSLVLL